MRYPQFVLVAMFISNCYMDIGLRLFLDIQGKEILDRLSELDNSLNFVDSYKTYHELLQDHSKVLGNVVDVGGAAGVWILMNDAKPKTKERVYEGISETAAIFTKNLNKLVDFVFQSNNVESALAHSQLRDAQTFVTQVKEINRISYDMQVSEIKDPQQRHDQIYDILRRFDDPLFSDYSTLSFPLLFNLVPLAVEVRPYLNQSDKVSCYLSSLIAEHFNIFLLDRLSKIEVVASKNSGLQGIAYVSIANTLRTPSYGAIEMFNNTCSIVNTALESLKSTNVYFVDKMATEGTILKGDPEPEDCAMNYFAYLRMLTENIVRPLYTNISQGCVEYKQPTGNCLI